VSDDRPAIRQSIEHFIRVVEAPDMSWDARLEALPVTLDGVAYFVHRAHFKFDDREFPDAPRINSKLTRALVEAHFPKLGHYNLADPTTRGIAGASIVVGDGIDDVAGIYSDVKEALWRWDNTSVDDALWCLTNSFGSHWGLHLRSLQYYLHILASGVDELPSNKSLERYTVSFGKSARTILYEDSAGKLVFTFDIGAGPNTSSNAWTLYLDRRPLTADHHLIALTTENERQRISAAAYRVAAHAQSCGYIVEDVRDSE
jgi:hypothetical protein